MPLTSICKSSGKAEEAQWLPLPTGPRKAPCPHTGSWVLLLAPDVVPPGGWHLRSVPCSQCDWQQGAGLPASSQECFKCFHLVLLGFFCSPVGVAGVSRVRGSFVTALQGRCCGRCHRAAENMGQEVTSARPGPALFQGSQ